MRLARKLQLAYLSLILIPVMIVSTVAFITYFMGSNRLGPFDDMEAPGWLKPELAAIFSENWSRYDNLKEPVVIFIMNREGYLSFPTFTDSGTVPDSYPHFLTSDETSGEVMKIFRSSGNMAYLPNLIKQFGTEWTIDIHVTPVNMKGSPYIVGWREPRKGIAGFMSRRGWIIPLIILILRGFFVNPTNLHSARTTLFFFVHGDCSDRKTNRIG